MILIKVLIRVLVMPVRSFILFLILLVEVIIECGTALELISAIDAVLAPAAIHAMVLEVVLLHLLAGALHTIISHESYLIRSSVTSSIFSWHRLLVLLLSIGCLVHRCRLVCRGPIGRKLGFVVDLELCGLITSAVAIRTLSSHFDYYLNFNSTI